LHGGSEVDVVDGGGIDDEVDVDVETGEVEVDEEVVVDVEGGNEVGGLREVVDEVVEVVVVVAIVDHVEDVVVEVVYAPARAARPARERIRYSGHIGKQWPGPPTVEEQVIGDAATQA
jgi:hypothetical protein